MAIVPTRQGQILCTHLFHDLINLDFTHDHLLLRVPQM